MGILVSDISIIIPVKDNQSGINRLLKSFFETQNENNFPKEIIIVDNLSRNEVYIQNEFKDIELKIHVIKCERIGPAAARNLGAKIAKGKWLFFTDSDCIFTETSLTGFSEIKICASAYAGNVSPSENTYLSRYYKQLNLLVPLEHPRNPKQPWYIVTANCLVNKEDFDAVEGFDESFHLASGEDVDLGFRLWSADKEIIYALQAKILHQYENKLSKFYKRFIRYGKGHALLEHKHGINLAPEKIKVNKKNLINKLLAIVHYSGLKKGYNTIYRD